MVALGSYANSFVLPVLTEVCLAVTFSLHEFEFDSKLSCSEIWSLEMGPRFDYLTHGAPVGFARDCPGKNWPLS